MSTTSFAVIFLLMIFSISSYIYGRLNSSSFYKNGKKQKIKSDTTFKVIYFWIKYSTLVFTMGSILFNWPSNLIIFNNDVTKLAGFIISVLSILIFIKSTRDLGENYSPCYDSYTPNQLVTRGIYSYIRHPIYTSNILLLVGLLLISGNVVVLINTVLLVVYYYRASVFEEQKFLATFKNYEEYRQKTKKFIPGVF